MTLVQRLAEKGVSLATDGVRLEVETSADLREEQARFLREHKAELIRELVGRGVREMAARWGYSADELAEALRWAGEDPEGVQRMVEADLAGRCWPGGGGW